jgi:hypothetical protein
MSQKKNDKSSQSQLTHNESNANYHKGSIVQFWRSHGFPSENTTNEKIGQPTLMFTNITKSLVEDDSLENSIRYLKFRSLNQ